MLCPLPHCTLSSFFPTPKFIQILHLTHLHAHRSVTPIWLSSYLSSIRFAWLSLTPCTESQRWRERVLCFPTWFGWSLWFLSFLVLFNLSSKSFPLLCWSTFLICWCIFHGVCFACFSLSVSQVIGYKP